MLGVGPQKPEQALLRGTLLGLETGTGAAALPEPLGLGNVPGVRTLDTRILTLGWYVAATAYRLLSKLSDKPPARSSG